MARQTSIDCYNEIKANGLLTKIRLKVLENVLELAPCTGTELGDHMLKKYNINGSWRVLTHLRDVGILYETGTRKCTVTGREVLEWDLTDNLPTKVKPIVNTKKNRIKTALSELRVLYKNKETATDEDWINVANVIKKI